MQDVTSNGVLRFDVVTSPANDPGGGSPNTGTAGSAPSDNWPAVATCRVSVVGSGSLVGTLVGIGDDPLPMG